MMNQQMMTENLIREVHEKGEIVSKGAVGFCDAENTISLPQDAILNIAFVGKNFTGESYA